MNCENKELFWNYYILIPCWCPQYFNVPRGHKTKRGGRKVCSAPESWSHQHFPVSLLCLSITPSSSLTLISSFFSRLDLEGVPPVFVQTHRTLCFSFSSFPSSVFISELSQPAQGQPGAALTLQAYWLRKREKILWTWFTMHEPHDTSFICTFFSMEKGGDNPHAIFITLTSGMSVIRYTDKAN